MAKFQVAVLENKDYVNGLDKLNREFITENHKIVNGAYALCHQGTKADCTQFALDSGVSAKLDNVIITRDFKPIYNCLDPYESTPETKKVVSYLRDLYYIPEDMR